MALAETFTHEAAARDRWLRTIGASTRLEEMGAAIVANRNAPLGCSTAELLDTGRVHGPRDRGGILRADLPIGADYGYGAPRTPRGLTALERESVALGALARSIAEAVRRLSYVEP